MKAVIKITVPFRHYGDLVNSKTYWVVDFRYNKTAPPEFLSPRLEDTKGWVTIRDITNASNN